MSTKKINVANQVSKTGSVSKSKFWNKNMFRDLLSNLQGLLSEGQVTSIATQTFSATAVTELSTTPSSTTYYVCFTPDAPSNNITAGTGGAISVARYYTTINTDAGGDAFTLADGVVLGQLKKIQLIVDGGGNAVITPATLFGGTTLTMADAGDFAILKWGANGWVAIELGNAIDGVTAPVIA